MVILIQVKNVVIRTGLRQLIAQYFPEAVCIQTQDKQHNNRLIAAFYDEKKVLILTDTEYMNWYSFIPDHFKLGVVDLPNSKYFINLDGDEKSFIREIEGKFLSSGMEEEFLSKREKEIAILIAEGKSNKEIAGILFISEHTVRTHRKHVYKKSGCRSAIELAKWLSIQH